MVRPILAAFVFLTASLGAQTPAPDPHIAGKDYAERSAAFVRYLAAATPKDPNFPKDAAGFHAARLQLGVDLPGTLKAIDRMLDATLKAKALAAGWAYSKPIGVSLNYELMRDGSGWLAAQEWPDLRDSAGNNAATIQKNCAGWLWRIWREATERNASEYDAPISYGTDGGGVCPRRKDALTVTLPGGEVRTLDFKAWTDTARKPAK